MRSMRKDLIMEEDEFVLKSELLSVLQQYPMVFFAIKNKYLDEHSWDIAMEADPTIFRFLRDPTYNDCLKAVLLDGSNIQYVPYRNLTYEVCATAIRNKPKSILLIPSEKIDQKLLQLAVDLDGTLIRKYEDDLDGFYLLDKVNEDPSLLMQMNHPDDDTIIAAINKNPGLMFTIPSEWWSDEVRNTIRSSHPDWAAYIPNK